MGYVSLPEGNGRPKFVSNTHSVGIGESEAWGLRILDFRPPKKDFCFTNG